MLIDLFEVLGNESGIETCERLLFSIDQSSRGETTEMIPLRLRKIEGMNSRVVYKLLQDIKQGFSEISTMQGYNSGNFIISQRLLGTTMSNIENHGGKTLDRKEVELIVEDLSNQLNRECSSISTTFSLFLNIYR